jgi:hypothetical protein
MITFIGKEREGKGVLLPVVKGDEEVVYIP